MTVFLVEFFFLIVNTELDRISGIIAVVGGRGEKRAHFWQKTSDTLYIVLSTSRWTQTSLAKIIAM